MSRGLINRLTRERDEARARVADLEAKIAAAMIIIRKTAMDLEAARLKRQRDYEYEHMSEVQQTVSGPEQV